MRGERAKRRAELRDDSRQLMSGVADTGEAGEMCILG